MALGVIPEWGPPSTESVDGVVTASDFLPYENSKTPVT
jgi:hypothetical protein